MLKPSTRRRGTRVALAAAFGLALAGPALAADLYRWKTEDGSWAYTDDAKRIPERYRGVAKTHATGNLANYSRFTPASPTTDDARSALSARLERLRAFNAATATPTAVASAAPGAVSEGGVVRVAPNEAPSVEVATGNDGKPIIIEERRFRIDGGFVTRTDTVVRQGDRIIAIVKPRARVIGTTNTMDIIGENELEGR